MIDLKKIAIMAALCMGAASCVNSPVTSWTADELALINGADSTMRVLTIADAADSSVLRKVCDSLTLEDLASPEFARLAELMIATVTSPEQDGVGIAGPQVGICRRVVAVERVDKEGSPFEIYPNIEIINAFGSMTEGREGCLSVPGKRGIVPRYQGIEISYTNPVTLADTTEIVQDFAAVIFQHEYDHLNGVIYTDVALSVSDR